MQVDLVGFSVVVVAQSNNPTILNPDFLLHNGIVSSSWIPHGDPVTTPVFSEVLFDRGLVVRADPEKITFEQAAASRLAPEDIDCPAIAKGYLRTIPHVPYTALGLNPRAVIVNPPFARLSKLLHAEGNWMTLVGAMPRFSLGAAYQMTDKRLTLTLQEGQSDTLLCEANIHRDVAETNQQMRVNSILSMLDCWRSDLDQFYAVVNQALRLEDGDVH